MNRTGLGRHGRIADESGDPLDGLVNLFDLGLVLAVAFLVAGLGLSVDKTTGKIKPRAPSTTTTTVPHQQPGPKTSGRGNAIGTLYRLADGRLVVVEPGGKAKPVTP